jgi:hypothetical protein
MCYVNDQIKRHEMTGACDTFWGHKFTQGLVQKLEAKRPLGISRHIWKNIKTDFEEKEGRVWNGLIWLRTGTSGDSCEQSNELSGSTKYDEFDFLSNC